MPVLKFCRAGKNVPLPKKGCRKAAARGFDGECPHQNIQCEHRFGMFYFTEEQYKIVMGIDTKKSYDKKQQAEKSNRRAVIIQIVKSRVR